MQAESCGITPAEAARLLGIARPTLLRLVGQGALRPCGPAGAALLSRAEVVAWRDRQAALRRDALAALARLSEAHDL
jgi:excisionase family DNA binding protein